MLLNKTCWYLQSVLHDLRWGIHDDGECGDEVNQEHDLHQDPLPASRHGHDNVVRYQVTQGEVAGNSHWEVDQKQD